MKFETPEFLSEKIDEYFAKVTKEKDIPTITDLAIYLDTSRETLREYKERPEFVDPIKKALDKCEAFIEKGILLNKLHAVAGIFNLKNNYGWKDKQEIDHTTKGKSFNDLKDKSNAELEQLAKLGDSGTSEEGVGEENA